VKHRPKGLLALATLAAVLAGGAWAFPPGAAKTAPAPDCCCADPSCPPGCCPDCPPDCCLTATKAEAPCCPAGEVYPDCLPAVPLLPMTSPA
jgi:hypothetical protein